MKDAESECTCGSKELICNLHVKTDPDVFTQSPESKCDISSGQKVIFSETCKGLGDLWARVLREEEKVILHESEETCNESLESLRRKNGKELSGITESLEQKLEEKIENLKEMATIGAKQISVLEREKAVPSEKQQSGGKYSDMEEQYKQDIEKPHTETMEKKEAESRNNVDVHLENERLKERLQDLEKEMAERALASEQQRLLIEKNHNFLNAEKDLANADLTRAHQNLCETMEKSKRERTRQKAELEHISNATIASMESEHTSLLNFMQENYQFQFAELTDKKKYLKKVLREVRERLELERREKRPDSESLEKKMVDLQEREFVLIVKIEILKKDREKQLNEMSETLYSENELLKGEMYDLDKQARDAGYQRSSMFMDNAKEQGKWESERLHLLMQRVQVFDDLESIINHKYYLFRGNESLRLQRENNRNPLGPFIRRPLPDPFARRGQVDAA